MLAEVHDGVGPEIGGDPAVGGEILTARRQVGIVVDRHRVLAESPRRLDQQHHVVGLHRGDHDLTLGVLAAIDEQFPLVAGPNV